MSVRECRHSQKPRGSALLGVLVLITIGSLLGTSILLGVDAQRSSSSTSMRQDQARALAWSGVLVAMTELAAQRQDLIAGLRPELTGEWVLFTDDLGREGVVRLLPVDDSMELAQSESGKLDINHATAEMLVGLDAIDETLAQKIVDARPYSSVVELLGIEGVTPALLYGEAESGDRSIAPRFGDDTSSEAESLYALSGSRLIDLLTVYSFEPNVQAALDDEEHRGNLRLNFDVEWSDALAEAIADRFGEGAVQGVKPLFDRGTSFATDADLCRVVAQIAPDNYEIWAIALDALTTSDDQFRLGRVDLNAAPASVLACIPGIDADAAEALVSMRESLSEAERQIAVWPLIHGVLTNEQFIQAVDWLSTRSLQYRVRIEVGWRPAREAAALSGAMLDAEEDRLEHRRVIEAVIDAASTRPRIAYMRDVTMLKVARQIAAESGAIAESLSAEPDLFADDPIGELFEEDPYRELAAVEPEREPAEDPMDLFDWDPIDEPEEEPEENRGSRERNRTLPEEPTSEPGDAPRDGLSERAPGVGSGADSPPDQVMVDRRIGRWTGRRSAR